LIVASNDLDEYIIRSLKTEQEACIDVWGVGTKLVTAYDQPALGAVYKLSAIKDKEGNWQDKLKLSEQAIKMNNPGIQQVRRYYNQDMAVADMIYDIRTLPGEKVTIIDPFDTTRQKQLDTKKLAFKDLLEPIFRNGECIYESPPIERIQKECKDEMGRFHNGVKRFVNPHRFPVGLDRNLYEAKTTLILKLRNSIRNNG